MNNVLFFLYKSLLFIPIFGLMIWENLDEKAFVQASYWSISLACIILIGGFIERKLAGVYVRYKTAKTQDVSKVIEVMARYLAIEFHSVRAHRESLRGTFIRRGFKQNFHIKAQENDLLVNLSGDFPFPVSVINWLHNHYKISEELRTHAYYKA